MDIKTERIALGTFQKMWNGEIDAVHDQMVMLLKIHTYGNSCLTRLPTEAQRHLNSLKNVRCLQDTPLSNL